MDKVKNYEFSLTSDSEDFIDDYWFLSPSVSNDGSSVNSIPWAADVVKQNQELWERVERMFFGEESLPDNDVKLSNEIREWTTHFPYFRVSGVAIPIKSAVTTTTSTTGTTNTIPSDPYFEEILAIHNSSDLNTNRLTAAVPSTARTSRQQPCDANLARPELLTDDVEKCLRITSGPLLSRRAQNSRTAYNLRNIIVSNNNNHSHAETFIQKREKWNPTIANDRNNKPQLKSALVRSDFDAGTQFIRKLYSSIDIERIHAVPYSARIVKVPALKNQTSDIINAISSSSSSSMAAAASTTTNTSNVVRIKTATLLPISRPIRNSITLPAIKNDRSLYNDAISALIYPDSITNSPNKVLLKKRSESE